MQMLQDEEKVQFLLHEDGSIQTKGNHLRSRLDHLTKARVLLSDFGLNIFNFAVPQQEAKAAVSHTPVQAIKLLLHLSNCY